MAWTTSGTISLTNGSAIVTGSGTTWASDGVTTGGDTLLIGGVLYQVLSVQSDTQLTLAANFAGTTVTGASYALIHTGLLPSALASSLSSLQSKYLTTVSQLYTWETATSGTVPLTNPATGATTNVTPLQAFMAASAQLSGAAFTGAISAPSMTANGPDNSGGVAGGIAASAKSQNGAAALNFNFNSIWTTGTGQPLAFGVNGTEQMRLTTTGLGVGTSAPSGMLDVTGSILGRLNIACVKAGSDTADQAGIGQYATVGGTGAASTYNGFWWQLGAAGQTRLWMGNSSQNGWFNALTVGTSGNLGLMVSPSSGWGYGAAIELGMPGTGIWNGFNRGQLYAVSNCLWNDLSWEYAQAGPASQYYQQGDGTHIWAVAPTGSAGSAIGFTQAMTLDNSGNLLVGTTSATLSNSKSVLISAPNGAIDISHSTASVGGDGYINFAYNAGVIGSITQNGTTGVTYNTTSDRRLKTNLGIATSSRIGDIVIHDYLWKADGTRGRGVFAQEAAKVIPEAVKVGDDGEEVTDAWQVDYSKFVPDLIVEVQALRARVAQLEATLH